MMPAVGPAINHPSGTADEKQGESQLLMFIASDLIETACRRWGKIVETALLDARERAGIRKS